MPMTVREMSTVAIRPFDLGLRRQRRKRAQRDTGRGEKFRENSPHQNWGFPTLNVKVRSSSPSTLRIRLGKIDGGTGPKGEFQLTPIPAGDARAWRSIPEGTPREVGAVRAESPGHSACRRAQTGIDRCNNRPAPMKIGVPVHRSCNWSPLGIVLQNRLLDQPPRAPISAQIRRLSRARGRRFAERDLGSSARPRISNCGPPDGVIAGLASGFAVTRVRRPSPGFLT